MNKFIGLALFAIIPICLGCCPENRYDKGELIVSSDSIKIFFKGIPNNYYNFKYTDKWISSKSGIVSIYQNNDIEYFDDLDTTKTPDNIFIKANDDYVIFRHYINYIDYYDYLIKKGDSISVEYIKGEASPKINVLNRKTPKNEFDFESIVTKNLKFTSFSPIGKYFNIVPITSYLYINDQNLNNQSKKLKGIERYNFNKKLIDSLRKNWYSEIDNQLRINRYILDSLRDKKYISTQSYSFNDEKLVILSHMINLEMGKMNESMAKSIIFNHKQNSYGYPDIYYYEFLIKVANRFLAPKANYMEFNDLINRDFREMYSLVNTTSIFSTTAKKYLLPYYLNKIHENFSREEFLVHLNKFQKDIRDSVLINETLRKYALELDSSRSEVFSVILEDLKEKKMTLNDVKNKHIGKVIYIDYWASWCGPCRESMPASFDLRNTLKNKDVVFVYLSIDNNIESWRKASAKEKLLDYSENYLIINHETSDFLKSNKLTSIPRYMIFDKEGRLLYANAPRVESSETGMLLTKLAAK